MLLKGPDILMIYLLLFKKYVEGNVLDAFKGNGGEEVRSPALTIPA